MVNNYILSQPNPKKVIFGDGTEGVLVGIFEKYKENSKGNPMTQLQFIPHKDYVINHKPDKEEYYPTDDGKEYLVKDVPSQYIVWLNKHPLTEKVMVLCGPNGEGFPLIKLNDKLHFDIASLQEEKQRLKKSLKIKNEELDKANNPSKLIETIENAVERAYNRVNLDKK